MSKLDLVSCYFLSKYPFLAYFQPIKSLVYPFLPNDTMTIVVNFFLFILLLHKGYSFSLFFLRIRQLAN